MVMQAMNTGPARRARERRRARTEIVSDATVQQILDLMVVRAMTMTQAACTVGASRITAWRRLHERRFIGAYECARVLAADALVTQAEEELDPPEDGAGLSAQQVKLRIERAKQKLWLATRLNPGLVLARDFVE